MLLSSMLAKGSQQDVYTFHLVPHILMQMLGNHKVLNRKTDELEGGFTECLPVLSRGRQLTRGKESELPWEF